MSFKGTTYKGILTQPKAKLRIPDEASPSTNEFVSITRLKTDAEKLWAKRFMPDEHYPKSVNGKALRLVQSKTFLEKEIDTCLDAGANQLIRSNSTGDRLVGCVLWNVWATPACTICDVEPLTWLNAAAELANQLQPEDDGCGLCPLQKLANATCVRDFRLRDVSSKERGDHVHGSRLLSSPRLGARISDWMWPYARLKPKIEHALQGMFPLKEHNKNLFFCLQFWSSSFLA